MHTLRTRAVRCCPPAFSKFKKLDSKQGRFYHQSLCGDVAQLGERGVRNAEARSSILLISTTRDDLEAWRNTPGFVLFQQTVYYDISGIMISAAKLSFFLALGLVAVLSPAIAAQTAHSVRGNTGHFNVSFAKDKGYDSTAGVRPSGSRNFSGHEDAADIRGSETDQQDQFDAQASLDLISRAERSFPRSAERPFSEQAIENGELEVLPKDAYVRAEKHVPKGAPDITDLKFDCINKFTRCTAISDSPDQTLIKEKFHWKPAMLQALLMQGFQHSYAIIFQEKTRRAIKDGPFIQDYFDSVKALRGWDDGNRFFTNYIAHPMQGAMTGFIFTQNHDKYRDREFRNDERYWGGTLKAFLWSTAWSTQWEIGPISQSSLGNVGLYGHMGMVDMVITPTVGTGLMVVEDVVDTYVIKHYEKAGFTVKVILRMLLNPTRTMANLIRFKEPWYRNRR